MTGSEKQIKWAESIKADAIGTCKANIDGMSREYPDYEMYQKVYQVMIDSLEQTFAKHDDAGWVIDHREMFSPRQINFMVDERVRVVKAKARA